MTNPEPHTTGNGPCVRCGGVADHTTATCCSSHEKRLCHSCYRRTHFVGFCPCHLCSSRDAVIWPATEATR